MKSDIVERLEARCTGHPNAVIPWPDKDLHDAISEIKRLRLVEGAARAVHDDMEVGNWSQYRQTALADALSERSVAMFELPPFGRSRMTGDLVWTEVKPYVFKSRLYKIVEDNDGTAFLSWSGIRIGGRFSGFKTASDYAHRLKGELAEHSTDPKGNSQ